MEDKSILEELLKSKGQKIRINEFGKKNSRRAYQKKSIGFKGGKSQTKEVIVKIPSKGGHGHSKEALKRLMNYIIKGTEEKKIYNNYGEEITKEKVNELGDIYSTGFEESDSQAKKKNRLFSHIIVSLPNNVEEYSSFKKYNDRKLKEIFQLVLQESITKKYGLNEYMIGIQENNGKLHAHVAILCKGADGYKLQINKKDIQKIREMLVSKLESFNIKLKATSFLKERKATTKIKRVHIEQGFKVGEVFKKKVPNWTEYQDKVSKFTIDMSKCKNIKEENKIKELQKSFTKIYKEPDNAIKSFLMMYKEDKKLATWTIYNQKQVFGSLVEKPEKNLEINIRNISTDALVDKNQIIQYQTDR